MALEEEGYGYLYVRIVCYFWSWLGVSYWLVQQLTELHHLPTSYMCPSQLYGV